MELRFEAWRSDENQSISLNFIQMLKRKQVLNLALNLLFCQTDVSCGFFSIYHLEQILLH